MKMNLRALVVALLLFVLPPAQAWAAAKFWVGGTGNLDGSTTTNISDTSGGAGGATYPVAGDTLTFDALSGGGTVTFTAPLTITTLTMANFTGTINTNGQTVTVSGTFSNAGSGVRTLNLGASAITVGTWNQGTVTNLTFNAGTSTITQTLTSTTFFGGGQTYATVILTGNTPSITGANTFGTLTRTGNAVKADSLILGANQTVSGTFTVNGNSSVNRVLVLSDTRGTARTITAATVTVTNADFQDITGAGAGSWDLSAITGLSGDAGGNSGITFTTPVTQYWYTTTTGTKTWSTAGNWFLATNGGGGAGRVPLPQDDVIFDANSIGAASTIVSTDMPRLGADVTFAGVANTPTISIGSAIAVFGSLELGNVALSGGSSLLFSGRGSHTLLSNGRTFPSGLQKLGPGTLTLLDAVTTTSGMTFYAGTFDANDFNVTARSFNSDAGGSPVGTYYMGNGTWTLSLTAGNLFSAGTGASTWYAEGSTLRVNGTLIGAISVATGGKTFNNFINETTGAWPVNFTGSGTFNNIHVDASAAARTMQFTAGTTTTVNTFTRDAGANVITLGSITASAHTLAKSGGGTISLNNMSISYSTASPATTWYAPGGTDGGNNTNWTFGAAPSGAKFMVIQ